MNKKGGNNKVVKVEQEKAEPTTTAASTTTEISQEIQDKLNVINEKIKKIFDENKKKMLQVEHTFSVKLATQFKKRSELLCKSKDFAGFWSSIISQAMIDNFADNDQEVANLITNVEVETNIDVEKEVSSRKIIFSFKDNSIFKNKQISKDTITDKENKTTVVNTPIEFNKSTPLTTNTTNTNKNAKKRKQVEYHEQSFILTWLMSDEPDNETMDEFTRLYEDPFSVLLDQEDEDEDEDDGEFDSQDEDEGQEDSDE